jgi:hypothetical protein
MFRAARFLVLPLLLAPAACLTKIEVPDTIYSPCHAIGSSDWSARVETYLTAHNRPITRRHLIVEGKVTVPGPGYSVALDLGPLERLQPRVQQVIVRTTGTGSAGDAPTTVAVRGVFPPHKHYGPIRIRCGDGTLATIAAVTDTTQVAKP